MRSLQHVNRRHLALRLAPRALRVRRLQLMRSLQHVNRRHLALRLTPRALRVRRLQLMRSLRHVNRRRLAPRALLRKKPLEVKNSLADSELTAMHGLQAARFTKRA
jgi:hypothetical protein